ncbi:MAG: glycine zipper domain-containing protein [Microcystis panniformis]
MGPLGLIPGAGVGSAVGRTVASQLGGETVRYLSGTGAAAQRWPVLAKNPAESLQATLERGATELIGETFGGMAGFMVGGSLLGPLGSLFGGVIGGAIGGQVGEEWWSWQRADLEKITPQAGA